MREFEGFETRLAALREALTARGFDGCLVPKTDRFQSEYLPPSEERLAWLTGFTGSAGYCVVLKSKAAVFVDGRYRDQAAQELDSGLFEIVWIEQTSVAKWLRAELSEDKTICYDPWLHNAVGLKPIKDAIKAQNCELQSCGENFIDLIWSDRPTAPCSPVKALPSTATDTSKDKRERMAAKICGQADSILLTRPDSLSWLLNVRSNDIEFNPVVLSWGLLHADARVDWFIDPERISTSLKKNLGSDISYIAPKALLDHLKVQDPSHRIGFDPAQCPLGLEEMFQESGIRSVEIPDPCLMAKALKSPTEIAGFREAHKRDARPVARCLGWIDAAMKDGIALDELMISNKLRDFRQMESGYMQDSFPAIVGTGANAAIIHYRVTAASSQKLKSGHVLLIDSGAHYDHAGAVGTTDITRTIWLGSSPPPKDIRTAATAVIKGHIALACARFPEGVTGAQLDVFARAPLWNAGLDYDHGTGHGVGHALCVHESPPVIGKRGSDIELKAGMVVSNEPGYYRSGKFGIRLESLLLAQEDSSSERGSILTFETLTYVPFDFQLFDFEQLTPQERDWLCTYQRKAIQVCSEQLDTSDDTTQNWLENMKP